MRRGGGSARLLLMLALGLALGLATAGLFAAGLESLLPRSPLLQRLVHFQPTTGPLGGAPSFTYDLGRASRRYLLLVAVVVLVASRSWAPWRDLLRRGLRRRPLWPQAGLGAAAALVMVSLFSLLTLVGRGARLVDVSPAVLAVCVGRYVVSAVVIAVLEELFFRGIVFRGMVRDWGARCAVVASSAVYAALHCISGSWQVAAGPKPAVGIALLGVLLTDAGGRPWLHLRLVIGLFGLGVLLALLYLRTGALWSSIGLHAGLVMGIKLLKRVTAREGGVAAWFFGDPVFRVSGIGWWLLLIVAVLVVPRLASPGPLYRRLRRSAAR